ncbi:MAG: CmpA/NrtA family ABC transporter substrate-binding protein [Aquificaceae bacterium]|jgi:nitrate/nitrite transport system substrate-binding protein|uniref:CmpA/NrtA family ABC transporter substrate-binding protein n=1 Tax=Hydrogenobacter sp. Uz 6-8 TaxID=3384828 RepID=UPI003094DE23
MNRRDFIRKSSMLLAGAGLAGPYISKAQAKLRIGYIPLTDCASVVMAQELGLYKKHGVSVEISKEASWPNVRDKLLNGELKASHCLFGMPFSVHMGIGGPAGRVMPIGMILNFNGQAITLSQEDFGGKVGFREISKVKAVVDELKGKGRNVTFAMTFPGGTHDIWLRYWLGACGINPKEVRVIPIPPPQMVANMKVNNMDGYCVGEPWNEVAVREGIGFTHLATQDIWKHHPEKALVFNEEYLSKNREEAKAIMKAVIEASMWLDDMKNRKEASKVLAKYVNAKPEDIETRLLGVYHLGKGLGEHTYRDDYMLFFKKGDVNLPKYSYGIFFLAQYRRWGMIKERPDYLGIAKKLIDKPLFMEVAREMKLSVKDDDMKPLSGFIDGVVFDPNKPEESIRAYKVKEV